jgi:hypothetical protein
MNRAFSQVAYRCSRGEVFERFLGDVMLIMRERLTARKG